MLKVLSLELAKVAIRLLKQELRLPLKELKDPRLVQRLLRLVLKHQRLELKLQKVAVNNLTKVKTPVKNHHLLSPVLSSQLHLRPLKLAEKLQRQVPNNLMPVLSNPKLAPKRKKTATAKKPRELSELVELTLNYYVRVRQIIL